MLDVNSKTEIRCKSGITQKMSIICIGPLTDQSCSACKVPSLEQNFVFIRAPYKFLFNNHNN